MSHSFGFSHFGHALLASFLSCQEFHQRWGLSGRRPVGFYRVALDAFKNSCLEPLCLAANMKEIQSVFFVTLMVGFSYREYKFYLFC
jgi:hypothetical protein